MLLELFNHLIKIGIPGAEAPRKPVSTAFGNSLAVGEYLKLPDLTGRNHGFNPEPRFDKGRETRDLGFVVVSRWTGNDLNFHCVL
jgi:hypothetical protein